MGQTIGRAPIQSEVLVFINLPRAQVIDLWEAFNDVAEGYGLTLTEVQDMFRVSLKEYLRYTDKRINALAEALFHLFDDDCNSLVDSLEFLSALSLVSGMSIEEKLLYIFGIYDFDESGVMTIDEMTLALRASASGLRKVSGIVPPHQHEIDEIARVAYQKIPERNTTGATITKEEFLKFAKNNPEISSWMTYFNEFDEVEVTEMAPHLSLWKQFSVQGPQGVMDLDDGTNLLRDMIDRDKISEDRHESRHPWRQTSPFSEPETLPEVDTSTLPNVNVTLDWVYGRNTKICGNSAFYSNTGEILYPAGATVVKFRVTGEGGPSQRYFPGHSNYITALAVHEEHDEGTIVATSHCGDRPLISIWSAQTMETLVALSSFHKVGVSHLDFSPSGELLLSVGMDQLHSLAVHKWRTREALFTTLTTKKVVLDMRFLGSDLHLGACGENFVHFWEREDGCSSFQRQRGLFGKIVPRQTMTCIAAVGSFIVSGSSTGDLCIWEGRSCIRVIQPPNSGSITSLHVVPSKSDSKGGVCASTSDGKIHMWNDSLELWATYNVAFFGGIDRCITSVCWNPVGKRILVGLKSCDLFELSDIDGSLMGPITDGHYDSKVWGLAVHPSNEDQIATVGEDKTLRIWDAEKHAMVRMVVLDAPAHCVSFNHDGTRVAVGLGRPLDAKATKEGAFSILKEADLTVLHEARDSKKTLTDCKYSRDGKLFAFGSQDRCIYIYDTSDFAIIAKAKGHTTPVIHLDFGCARGCDTAAFIQSNSENGELMFWTTDGKHQTPRSQRETEWETQTCCYGWPLKAAHVFDSHNDRPVVTACSRSFKGDHVVISDSIGRIRLSQYPAISDGQFSCVFRGHSSMIQDAKFSYGDKWLCSLGTDDCCLFQWRYICDNVSQDVEISSEEHNDLDLLHGKELDEHDYAFEHASEGEECDLPARPWTRAIVAPTEIPEKNHSHLESDLELEWIYGFNASRCRSNLIYSNDGQLIYKNVGRTFVKYDVLGKVQSFNQDAKDEITCVTKHPNQNIFAVGQTGRIPCIHIINVESMKTVQVIKGHHSRAISSLRFDPSGRKLVSVGQDKHHSLIVYDWTNGTVIASTQTCDRKTFCVDFQRDGKGLIQCGLHLLRFWTLEGRIVNFKNAYFADKGKNQPFFSIGWDGNCPVVGTLDGCLYRFLGRKLDASVKAHASTIFSIHSTSDGIVTGSGDGCVKLWGPSLVCRLSIDMQKLGSLKSSIKSVCWNNEVGKVLVGTAGNEIWELSADDGHNFHQGPLEQGHFEDNLSGLAISPNGRGFATVGDDKTLRVWDVRENRMLKSTTLENVSRACFYSPDGTMLAVGYGSHKKVSAKEVNGKWVIMDENDFAVLHETRDSRKFITEIKWCKNGKYIAVGSFDNSIYVYEVAGEKPNLNVTLSSIVGQHNSYITHFDFSVDGKYLQSNCGAYELCFHESETGLHIPAASRLKDVVWESQTCTLGYSVQGIWPQGASETDIVSVDCSLSVDEHNPCCATGDNFGTLKLARYPCISSGAQFKSYRAHHGPIAQVRWAGGCSHLVTIGSSDQAIMIWKRTVDDPYLLERSVAPAPELPYKEPLLGDYAPQNRPRSQIEDAKKNLAPPWVGKMVEPSKTIELDSGPPAQNLELVFAHGFQAQTVYGSLVYNGDGDIIYPASKLAIVYNKDDHQQRCFRDHNSEISAICVSPSGRYIASGEAAFRPKVFVWDASTCVRVAALPQFHQSRIVCISFSSDSKKLVTVGCDDKHSICIWTSLSGEWHDTVLQTQFQNGVGRVMFAHFIMYNQNSDCIACGGHNVMNFWTLWPQLTLAKGIFGTAGKVQTMLCGALVGNKFITGTPSGHLYIWLDRKLEKIIKVHHGHVNSLRSFLGGLVTGGEDGCVKLLSKTLEPISSFDLANAAVSSLNQVVRSVDVALDKSGEAATKILVGTCGSEIYEISIDTGNIFLLHEGHFEKGLFGLAMHPLEPDIFATCGDDRTIRIFSISLNRLLKKVQTDCSMRSICWSNDGKELLVGCGGSPDGQRGKKDGVFMIIDFVTMDVVLEGRDSKDWITDAKYSPDEKLFAISSADHKIYFYENSKKNRHKLQAVAEKHNALISSIDFSADSWLVQSASNDREHLAHEAGSGDCLSLPSQLKNIDWETYNCIYGWPVQGIWPPMKDANKEGEPTCVDRSRHEKTVLAVGTKDGQVKLYNYPVIDKQSLCQVQEGHVGQVAKCRFSCDGSTLVTIGKSDRMILVWKIKGDPTTVSRDDVTATTKP